MAADLAPRPVRSRAPAARPAPPGPSVARPAARRSATARRRAVRLAPALAAVLLASVLAPLAGCGTWQVLTRPEGDGGWTPERRRSEVGAVATAAGVDVDGGSGSTADGPTGATARARIAPIVPAAAPSPAAPEPASSPAAVDSASSPGAPEPAPSPGAPAPVARDARRLDLPTALAMATTGNRRIAEAGRQLDATGERVMDVRGRLLPATTANSRYSWYSDAQTTNVDLPPGLLPPGTATPVVKVRDPQNGTVNGTILLPIDLTGEFYHSLQAAQAGYRGERARVWAVTLEQQIEVVRAYYDLLEALRLREVAVETAKLYREQAQIADDRFRNGRLLKNDLLTFQVALRNAEQQVLRQDLQIDRARFALNDAIGADVNRATDPVDVVRRPVVPPIDEALRLTWENNPLLLALLEEQQRLEETATALVRSRLPRVQGGGAVDYQTSDLLVPQQIGSGFVGFQWDLGTDLRRESQISAARIEADRNRIAMQRQMRELEAAVRSTQLAAEERLAAYSTAEVAVGQADENLRIRRQQFDVGRAQSDDVLTAERLLSSERATLASALYQAHVRRAELQRLMGLPIDGE